MSDQNDYRIKKFKSHLFFKCWALFNLLFVSNCSKVVVRAAKKAHKRDEYMANKCISRSTIKHHNMAMHCWESKRWSRLTQQETIFYLQNFAIFMFFFCCFFFSSISSVLCVIIQHMAKEIRAKACEMCKASECCVFFWPESECLDFLSQINFCFRWMIPFWSEFFVTFKIWLFQQGHVFI